MQPKPSNESAIKAIRRELNFMMVTAVVLDISSCKLMTARSWCGVRGMTGDHALMWKLRRRHAMLILRLNLMHASHPTLGGDAR